MGSLTSFLLSSLLNIEKTYLSLGFYFTFDPNIVLTIFEGEQDSLLLCMAPEPGLHKKAKNECSFMGRESMVHGACLQSRILDAELNGTQIPWSEHLLV